MTAGRAFIVALVFVAVVVVGAVVLATQITTTTAARSASVGRLLLLERMKVSLLRSESSQRAYLLTGDDAYLQLTERNAADVMQHLNAMSAAGYSTRVAPEDVAELYAAARRRIDALDAVVSAFDADGPAAVRGLIREQSAVDMERFLAVSARVEQSETVELQALRDRSDVLSSRLLLLLGIGALFNLALLAFMYRVLRSDVRSKRGVIERMEKRGGEFSHLNELNSALLSAADQAEANRIVRHYMRLLLPRTAGGLYLFRASRNILELQATWGEPEGVITESVLSDECWSLRRGDTHVHRGIDDLECEHVDRKSAAHYCCVPMMARGETLGMLHVQCDTSDSVQLQLVETVASQIASAMANLQLRAVLHSQSIKDPLTGLFNRRYLEETMQREELRAARNKSTLSLVMLDLDHFKAFNDDHGHQAGDQVLRMIGETLRHSIRGEDIACRYGGEEFTLILPGAGLEDAVHRAEQVRASVARLSLRIAGRTLDSLTASLGVATYPDHGDNWTRVLQAADAALYRAKQQGRDRVVAAGATDS